MGEKLDEAKGRVKEAAGDLTDDKDLKREGKLDQAGATVKEKAGDAADKVSEAVDTAKDKLTSND
ncbi:MAG: CsbD family protein [Acidimicrobiia bacterium]